MCISFNVEKNSLTYIKWLKCLVFTTGVLSFFYWFLIAPLLFSKINENQTRPPSWIISYWIIGFFIWCFIMLTILFVWCYLKYQFLEKADEPKNDEILKNLQLKEHVQKKLGILDLEKSQSRKSIFSIKNELKVNDDCKKNRTVSIFSRLSTTSRRKQDEVPKSELDITPLPDFTPESQKIIDIDGIMRDSLGSSSKADDTPTGSPLSSRDPVPFNDYLHLVQVESPSTPKIPEKEFFKALKQTQHKEKLTDKPEDIVFEVEEIYEADDVPGNVIEAEELDEAEEKSKTAEISFKDLIDAVCKADTLSQFDFDAEEADDVKTSPKKKFFIGTIGRQQSVTSEIFMPIDEHGHLMNEPMEMGKFEILKADDLDCKMKKIPNKCEE